MRFSEFEHVLGAAADATHRGRFVVIGSQAILGTTRDPPPNLLVSMEVDVYIPDEPEVTDLVEALLGDGSMFHRTHGFYAHAVGPETAKAPTGWKDRLRPVSIRSRPGQHQEIQALCMEIHDLVLSKAVAGRDRDWAYARDAMVAGLVSVETLLDRIRDLPVDRDRQDEIRRLVRRARIDARSG
ncbi:DUF6036 family nucleotidyltransferase [Patulibacter sp. S7RM1-6]